MNLNLEKIKIFEEKLKNFIRNTRVEDIVGIAILVICFIYVCVSINKMSGQNEEKKAYEIELMEHPRDSFKGNSFVTDTYPVFRDAMMIGDSYSHFISYDLGFDVINYSCPGLTLRELESVFDVALRTKKKYVTIFIGPNDFYANTSLEEFGTRLSDYVSLIKEKIGAKVILCTYLHSVFSKTIEANGTCAHSIDEYNAEIKKLEDEKNGVYFLDLSELDEHEKYQKDTPTGPDDIHYNYDFSVKFINKLYDKLMYIKEKEITNG